MSHKDKKHDGELSDQQLDDVSGGQEVARWRTIVVTAKRLPPEPKVVKMETITVTAPRDKEAGTASPAPRSPQADTKKKLGRSERAQASACRASSAAKGPALRRELLEGPLLRRSARASSTTMRSASRTVFRRCAITMRVASSFAERLEHRRLRHVVERARRLVEQQDARRRRRARARAARAGAVRPRASTGPRPRACRGPSASPRCRRRGPRGAPLPTRLRRRGSPRRRCWCRGRPPRACRPAARCRCRARRWRRSSVARSLAVVAHACPSAGDSKPSSRRSSVDLPEPLAPDDARRTRPGAIVEVDAVQHLAARRDRRSARPRSVDARPAGRGAAPAASASSGGVSRIGRARSHTGFRLHARERGRDQRVHAAQQREERGVEGDEVAGGEAPAAASRRQLPREPAARGSSPPAAAGSAPPTRVVELRAARG